MLFWGPNSHPLFFADVICPQISCVDPGATFFISFQVVTLGITGLIAYICVVWAIGIRVLRHWCKATELEGAQWSHRAIIALVKVVCKLKPRAALPRLSIRPFVVSFPSSDQVPPPYDSGPHRLLDHCVCARRREHSHRIPVPQDQWGALLGGGRRREVSGRLHCLVAMCLVTALQTGRTAASVFNFAMCPAEFSQLSLKCIRAPRCYDGQHMAYFRAGVFWTILYPVGIPVFYFALLHYYSIPTIARELTQRAYISSLVHLARRRRVELPGDVDIMTLTVENMSNEYVDALYHGLLEPRHEWERRDSSSRAGGPSWLRRLSASASEACRASEELRSRLSAKFFRQTPPGYATEEEREAAQAREVKLRKLLAYADVHLMSDVSLSWDGREGDPRMAGASKAIPLLYRRDPPACRAAAAPLPTSGLLCLLSPAADSGSRSRVMLSQRVPRGGLVLDSRRCASSFQQPDALSEAWVCRPPSDLFRSPSFAEAVNKLLISGAIRFISPGTNTQVFSGLAITFGFLLLYQRILPYHEKAYRHIGLAASLILFLYFGFALLLKAEVEITSNPSLFYAVVFGALSISTFSVPAWIIFKRSFWSLEEIEEEEEDENEAEELAEVQMEVDQLAKEGRLEHLEQQLRRLSAAVIVARRRRRSSQESGAAPADEQGAGGSAWDAPPLRKSTSRGVRLLSASGELQAAAEAPGGGGKKTSSADDGGAEAVVGAHDVTVVVGAAP